MGNIRGRICRAVVVERTSFTENPPRILDCADIGAKVEDIDEMDVDWDGTSNNENKGYE